MRLVRLLAFGALSLAIASCKKDIGGTSVTLDPIAGLRYINLVSDTGAMDFRVIDIVGDAPNTIAATFRSGGQPYGIANPVPTQPPYFPVRAGSRHIRVFMDGSTPAIASTVMFDTTFTFVANVNYTFFLYGFARTGSTPAISGLITADTVPVLAAGKYGLRVINLAPSLNSSVNQPANVNTPVDAVVSAGGGAVPAVAIAGGTLANVAFGNVSAYVPLDTATAAFQRMVVTATGTTTPQLFTAGMPAGTAGNATTNPAAGTRVAGTVITAVIVPRSVPASLAPTTASKAITTVTRSNDTVTVTAAAVHGLAVGDVVNITGATQPEYNMPGVVVAVPTTTTFQYRITGAPATPATGVPVFRPAKQGLLQALDYSTPSITFLVDQQPPRTAP